MMNVASSSSVAVSFGSRRLKRMTPSGAARAPVTITSPSTSSALANSEPMIDVCATTVCPARSAKITMNSSGRLPSVDCSTPGHGRSVAPADLLGPEADDVRERGERDRGQRERHARGPPGVARDAGRGGRREGDHQRDPLDAGEGGRREVMARIFADGADGLRER